MAGPALLFAGASAGLDLISGLFGQLVSQEASAIAESRGRMIRLEAEAEVQRYQEQVRGFRATQKLAFLKSGVTLTGSPLDILDETARVATENISAIRARGAAGQLEAGSQAAQARISGRNALLSGLTGGLGKLALAGYASEKNTRGIAQAEKNLAFDRGSIYSPGYRGGWGNTGIYGSTA